MALRLGGRIFRVSSYREAGGLAGETAQCVLGQMQTCLEATDGGGHSWSSGTPVVRGHHKSSKTG